MLFIVGCGPTNTGVVEEVLDIEKVYFTEWDKMDLYYADFYNTDYNTLARVDNGLENIGKAKETTLKIDDSVTQILSLAEERMPSLEGNEKEWVGQIEQCYTIRSERTGSLLQVEDNYEKYLLFLKEDFNSLTLLEDFSLQYNEFVKEEDDDKASKILTDMSAQLGLIRDSISKKQAIVDIPALEKQKQSLEKLKEAFGLLSKAISDKAKEQEYVDQASDLIVESDSLNIKFQSEFAEQTSQWFIDNIENPDRQSYEQVKESNVYCDKASEIYDLMYS